MKEKNIFVCSQCGNEFPKWMGKCTACGSWNTIYEEKIKVSVKGNVAPKDAVSLRLDEIDTTAEERLLTGFPELDRVLGGGLVKGSLVLVGGDPGIGKSTLLLQACGKMAPNSTILYVSGEESQRQIKLRADRLSVNSSNIHILSETDMSSVFSAVDRISPDILIIDSVQTMYCEDVASSSGSVSQIKEVATTLMRVAKSRNISVFLVGHVTKEGAIAGPKVLEHIVDTVLYFEGERHQAYRIIRAVKNRFGSTNEIGVFEMGDEGLKEIENPSQALLSGRPDNPPGTCIICAMEGTRPVLAEIQALCSQTSFGNPRRMTTGVDVGRALMLLAVIEKRAGLHISAVDTYINVVGGLRLFEPAVDLGVIMAVASSFKNTPLDKGLVAIGEVGLTGEIRSCSFLQQRVAEAEKLGFEKVLVPYNDYKKLKKFDKIEVCPVKNIYEAINNFI